MTRSDSPSSSTRASWRSTASTMSGFTAMKTYWEPSTAVGISVTSTPYSSESSRARPSLGSATARFLGW
ncbi:Uncharacterised protein [Mycobacteroides abscessus subsp. abscessus]|nr:Uncharacterised protein [Mycobacteroides abscessus subsp. abscessus]